MTAWDTRALLRALALSLLLFACAVFVTAVTDEGNIAFAERVSRTLPALPLACAAGAYLTLAPLRARGEVRALAALGRTPWEIARPLVLASVITHAAAAAALPALPIEPFFPRPPVVSAVAWDGSAFVDRARGVRVLANGSMEVIDKSVPLTPPAPPLARPSVALALVLAGAALPMLALSPRRRPPLLVLAGALAATIACFHAAATSRLPAPLAAAPPAALLALAARLYREPELG